MKILSLQVRHPTGNVDHVNIEHEHALVGSGAHCDLRLALDQAAPEHVRFEVTPAGQVYAEALHFEPPPTMNGVPFQRAPIAPGTVVGVGPVQIVAQAVDTAGSVASTEKKRAASPLSLLTMAVIVAAVAYLYFGGPKDDPGIPKPPKEPELWSAQAPSCPVPGGEQALALAREKRAIADAKRERRPFHVQDGVKAVPLYELAASCYAAGGDVESKNQAVAAAASLRKELTTDYLTQRVRLEHALSVKDLNTAQHQVKVLLAFTEDKQGDYVTWLSNLDRRLKLKLGSGGPTKS